MIAGQHRQKGGAALGARKAGEHGPFGQRPDEDGDGQDDEQQQTEEGAP